MDIFGIEGGGEGCTFAGSYFFRGFRKKVACGTQSGYIIKFLDKIVIG